MIIPEILVVNGVVLVDLQLQLCNHTIFAWKRHSPFSNCISSFDFRYFSFLSLPIFHLIVLDQSYMPFFVFSFKKWLFWCFCSEPLFTNCRKFTRSPNRLQASINASEDAFRGSGRLLCILFKEICEVGPQKSRLLTITTYYYSRVRTSFYFRNFRLWMYVNNYFLTSIDNMMHQQMQLVLIFPMVVEPS